MSYLERELRYGFVCWVCAQNNRFDQRMICDLYIVCVLRRKISVLSGAILS